ncbi:MAG TPA: PEGA domain-containing protein [Blastocatellia bacterium]|nr:PEGA domain-containing protein [Blastocatellia bacterium]
MRPTNSYVIRSFFVWSLFVLAACSPVTPTGGNNQNTGNANTAQSKPANGNSSPATKQAKGASIEVTSVPPGAGVTLIPTSEGGASLPQSYGVTPATIPDLAPGNYTVHLEKTGYKYFQKEVKITGNETVRVNAPLKKQAADKRK